MHHTTRSCSSTHVLAVQSKQCCLHCGKIAERMSKCTRCDFAAFCSKDCQKASWADHCTACNEMRRAKGRAVDNMSGHLYVLREILQVRAYPFVPPSRHMLAADYMMQGTQAIVDGCDVWTEHLLHGYTGSPVHPQNRVVVVVTSAATLKHMCALIHCNATQADEGVICAYWVNVLIAALSTKATVPPVFIVAALRHLLTAVYFYTGHIVPVKARTTLARNLSAQFAYVHSVGRQHMNSDDQVLGSRINATLALIKLLHVDKAFARHVAPLSHMASTLDGMGQHMLMLPQPTNQFADPVVRAMYCWPTQPQLLNPFSAGEAVPGLARVACVTVVRGCGLAASAYGWLHHNETVGALIATWSEGPWAGRLRIFDDYITTTSTMPDFGAAENQCHCGKQHWTVAQLACAKKSYGRWPGPPMTGDGDNTPGAIIFARKLQTVRPMVQGGSSAMLMGASHVLPGEFAAWHRFAFGFDDMAKHGAFACVSGGPVTHYGDKLAPKAANASLLQDGPAALRALAKPPWLADVRELMGNTRPVAVQQ